MFNSFPKNISFHVRGVQHIMDTNDTTGRLLKYDPLTKKVTVLMKGLNVPGGTEVSKDSTFVLVAEYLGNKILKYWLEGPKANSSEILLEIPGPGNIKRTPAGDFWVPSTDENAPKLTSIGVRFNEFGRILETVDLPQPYKNEHLEQIHEHNHALYVGSLFHNFIGVLERASLDQQKEYGLDGLNEYNKESFTY